LQRAPIRAAARGQEEPINRDGMDQNKAKELVVDAVVPEPLGIDPLAYL